MPLKFLRGTENKNMRDVRKKTILCLALAAAGLLSGCHRSHQPRLRLGAFFGSPAGMSFPDPNHLGQHHYAKASGEKLGMVYTCRGGFIDVGHVREAADRTAYLSDIIYRNLMQGRRTFSFRVIEPSRYHVNLLYPRNWYQLSDEKREAVATEVSILLGQYVARTSLVWHEIVTWYGFSSTWVFSENISAFSCEDTYSDLLGTRLAVQSLRRGRQEYDAAMTALINEALRELGVQPASVAREAAKRIKGQWYSGGYYFFVDMKKRNFDVGLTDGRITPWLVDGICPGAEPQTLPVPDTAFMSNYGFGMEIEIDPRVMEKGKIYRDLALADRNSRVRPAVDFPVILEHIRNQAAPVSDTEGTPAEPYTLRPE